MTQGPEAAGAVRESEEILTARGDTVEDGRERDFRFARELPTAGIGAMVVRG